METKEYFEKVMQAFRSTMSLGSSKNQHRNGRSLRKYCQDEGIDYKWLDGGFIDINSNNLAAVTSLLQSFSSPC